MANDIAQAKLRHLLGGEPEVVQERAIDVLAALVAIDVRDRRRHAVHDRAQLRFARSQCVLRLLQVGDVVPDGVVALDRAVEAEVGNDAVAQPQRAAVGIDTRAFVGDGLALRGALEMRALGFEHIGSEHLFGRLADHVVAIEADHAQERVVDEGVLVPRRRGSI